MWSGLTKLREIVEPMGLRTFRAESSEVLYGVEDGVLPDPDTPAGPAAAGQRRFPRNTAGGRLLPRGLAPVRNGPGGDTARPAHGGRAGGDRGGERPPAAAPRRG
nr:hypothetical protein [Amycolatopsis bullii]